MWYLTILTDETLGVLFCWSETTMEGEPGVFSTELWHKGLGKVR